MRVTFYSVRDEETGELKGLAASTERGVYRWIPNFGSWVRSPGTHRRLTSYDPDPEIERISVEEAEVLISEIPRLDGRRIGWHVDQYAAETDRLSHSDLGLELGLRVKRPTSNGELLKAVKGAAFGEWVPMRRFVPGKAEAARTWVSEVRLGKKKRLAALGPLEAIYVELEDGSIEARVRCSTEGMALVQRAQQIAARAHGLQKDKAGYAYIDHPRRVAERLNAQGEDTWVVAAGWLHDVLEDTTMTASDLIAEGIPDEVVAAVDAVSRREGEAVDAYATRIRGSEMGLKVKLADLADNTDPDRLALLDEGERSRLEAKYAEMRSQLGLVLV